VFVTDATAGISKCVSTNSDLLSSVAGARATTAPASCTTTPPPTNVVAKVETAQANPTALGAAITAFSNSLVALYSKIDPTTGVALAQDFDLVVIAVASPVMNTDNSLTLSVLITFIPTGTVQTPTDAHKALYCPLVVNLLASTGGFSSANLGPCQWTAQPSAKRTASSATTYSASSNVNSTAVDNIYGTSSDGTVQAMSFLVFVVLVMMALFF